MVFGEIGALFIVLNVLNLQSSIYFFSFTFDSVEPGAHSKHVIFWKGVVHSAFCLLVLYSSSSNEYIYILQNFKLLFLSLSKCIRAIDNLFIENDYMSERLSGRRRS